MAQSVWMVSFLIIIFSSTVRLIEYSVNATLESLELWHCTSESLEERCMQSSGADREQVQLLWTQLMYSNNRDLKCYLACMYTNVEFLNNHGELVGNMIVQENDKIITMEEFEVCENVTKCISDKCEKTFEFSYCLTHTKHTSTATKH